MDAGGRAPKVGALGDAGAVAETRSFLSFFFVFFVFFVSRQLLLLCSTSCIHAVVRGDIF